VDEIFLPWREAAGRHGFRLLERHESVWHLLSGATFLDLAAEAGGISSATLKTWIDAGAERWALTTYGVPESRPRPPGAAGWVAAHVVAPLMQRMVPPADRPVAMKGPEDLRAVIEKHMQDLLAVGGKPVQFPGDPLQARFDQERRDNAA
jgi:hypothetical protein